jgi:hypothetical protein
MDSFVFYLWWEVALIDKKVYAYITFYFPSGDVLTTIICNWINAINVYLNYIVWI